MVGDLVAGAGGEFVDGGIIGPPAHQEGSTRLYLSGPSASAVAAWFEGTMLEAIAIGGSTTSASALKMCYAGYTKGVSALVLAIRSLAEAEGVSQALVGEWNRSQPGLADRSELMAAGTAPKAWRFVGEMEEIAGSFDAAGLPVGFHTAAAEIYSALSEFKDQPDVGLDEVVRALLT
jgi:3-hydroxyisobutyrate dehydrogenase-like beta-hydroxyacid dehydrogenase